MAGNIKGITVEIAGNTSKLSTALKSVNKDISGTQTALKQVDRLLKLDPTNTELLAQKQKLLAKAIEQAKTKVDALKQAQEQAKTALADGDLGQDEYDELTRDVIAAEQGLKQLENAADGAGGAVEDSGSDAQKAANGGWTVLKGVIADLASSAIQDGIEALKDFAGSVVETGSEFESTASQLAATMGTTTDQITELTDFAKEMGATTQYTATEAAEGLNILAQSGMDAESQMALLPNVMNLASAGSMDLSTAAGYLTTTLKGYGESADEAQKYTDIMAAGATLANTDVNALGNALADSSATASSYGQNVESVTLSLLELANQGVTGSEAATSLNRAMADLYTPTSEASAALTELGVSAYNADGTTKDFNDVCGELQTALSGMSEEEANAYKNTIFTTNGLDAFNKMTAASASDIQSFKSGIASASDAMGGQGSAAQQAATQLDNYNGAVTLMESALDGVKMQLWDMISGPLTSLVQTVTGQVIPAVSQVISWVQENSAMLSDIAVVIGAITAAIEIYATAQGIATAITAAKEAADAAGAASLMAYAAAQAAALAPVIAIVAAIAAVIAVIVLCIKHWDEIKAVAIQVANAIKTAVSNAFTALKAKLSSIMASIKSAISTAWNAIKSTVSNVIEGIKSVCVSKFNAVKSSVTSIFNGIKSTISNVMNSAKTIVSNAIAKIKSAFNFTAKFNIKTPHISVTTTTGALGLTIPKISIQWYKKAMNDAMVLNNATIFGSAGGQLLGGGEGNGAEVVSGEAHLMEMISQAAGGSYVKGIYSDLHTLANGGLYNTFNTALQNQPNMTLREFSRMVKQYA